jgi:hypothetical protein
MSVKLKVSRRLVSAVGAAVLLGLTMPNVAGASGAHAARTPQSEVSALKRVKWTSNVTVSISNGSWTFKSDGLPTLKFVATNYAVPANPLDVSASGASVISSAMVLKDQNYDYTLPLTPKYSQKVTSTNQGPIGVLLDGGALYNPYEANHATVATSDNFVVTSNGITASFLDTCDGHPGPGGQYHYHGLPACLVSYATGGGPSVHSVTSTSGTTTYGVSETNGAAKKPVILGFAFDGYGIYDNVAMNGATIPVSSLDSCNGIDSPVPGYPSGVYHYVLENVKGARSSIGCYHGVVSSAYTQALEGVLSGGNANAASTPSASTPATAQSLAANTSEDNLLVAMLKLSGLNNDC